jgi:ring-1,2-phenylacetyl-CoA epoxidase subunit PaaC
VLLLAQLSMSCDARVAGIATKALTEVRYHIERSAGWVIRLGDGTALSHARMQAALDALWMYTGEMFAVAAAERALIDAGIAADAGALHAPWLTAVQRVLAEATLAIPDDPWMQGGNGRGGKQGVHTEHLSRMLAEMQVLPRTYPEARW